jgi:hypothetical protein
VDRKDCFIRDYGKNIETLSRDKGKLLPIYEQVYKLNGLIYRELDICRDEGINPKNSECYNILLKEGKERFEKYNYKFNGRIFVHKDKLVL